MLGSSSTNRRRLRVLVSAIIFLRAERQSPSNFRIRFRSAIALLPAQSSVGEIQVMFQPRGFPVALSQRNQARPLIASRLVAGRQEFNALFHSLSREPRPLIVASLHGLVPTQLPVAARRAPPLVPLLPSCVCDSRSHATPPGSPLPGGRIPALKFPPTPARPAIRADASCPALRPYIALWQPAAACAKQI